MDDALIEHQLRAVLYRLDCPDTAELGEYHLKMVDVARRTEIERHLRACPHCSGELAQLHDFLADLTPELRQGAYRPLKVWVARLVSQTGGIRGMGSGLQPAFAVRGEAQPPRIYEAGDAQIVLEIQDESSPTVHSLIGLILGVDSTGLTAHLWRGNDPIQSAAVDELGNFILVSIKPGNYELVISNSELEIRIPSLDI